MKSIVIISCIIIGIATQARAQATQCSFPSRWDYTATGYFHYQLTQVTGEVRNGDNKKANGEVPLNNVCLALYNELNLKLTAATQTDKRGKYDFGEIPPGLYRLITQTKDFNTANIPVRVYSQPKGYVERRRVTLVLKSGLLQSTFFLTNINGKRLNEKVNCF